MAIEGIQDLWHAVKGDLDVKSKNFLKEATGHKVDNIVDLAELVSTVGSAKAASKTSSKAFSEASSKLRRELNKARKVETVVSEEACLTSRAARQFIRRECGAFRGPKRVAKPVDFGRLFKKHGVKTAPGPGLQPLSEAELEKVVGGAKDPSWRPGGAASAEKPKAPRPKSDSQLVVEKSKEAVIKVENETTADLLRNAKITSNGGIYVDAETLNKIGAIESRGGKAFSDLIKIIKKSKPATWKGKQTGGIESILEFRDEFGTKFVIHEVIDEVGNIVHRDFDAVRIASGQVINKARGGFQ